MRAAQQTKEAAGIRCLRQRQRNDQPAEPGGERILVAEDDKFLRTLAVAVLCRRYTIIETIGGEDAARRFRNSPEAIDLRCWTWIYQRKREIFGADTHFLPKPFGPRFLLNKIRKVLGW